jgi:hypothetical protein
MVPVSIESKSMYRLYRNLKKNVLTKVSVTKATALTRVGQHEGDRLGLTGMELELPLELSCR